jgi:hypothetical protein
MDKLKDTSKSETKDLPVQKHVNAKNSLIFKIICTFTMTYYGMAAVVLIVALVFNEFLTMMSRQYLPDMEITRIQLFLFILLGLLMNLGAVFGSALVLFQKRNGITVFVLSSVLIIIYQFVLSGPDGWQKYVVELGLLLFFLLFLPSGFKKMQPKKA